MEKIGNDELVIDEDRWYGNGSFLERRGGVEGGRIKEDENNIFFYFK